MTAGPLEQWDGRAVADLREAWGVARLEAYDVIGSTNDRALALARTGAAGTTVVVADEQSRGRGRQGASWWSPRGCGLWMSVALPEAVSRGRPFLPLLVGLAVARAIERVAAGVHIGLKWPNDLLIGDRKVGGILCEATGSAVVAGVGVNVRTPPGGVPAELAEIATALDRATSKRIGRHVLAGHVVEELAGFPGDSTDTLSPAALAALSSRDVLRGRPIRTEQLGDGVAAGIAPDGALLVERADGTSGRVVSGNVRLR